jgi:hypothetical protein
MGILPYQRSTTNSLLSVSRRMVESVIIYKLTVCTIIKAIKILTKQSILRLQGCPKLLNFTSLLVIPAKAGIQKVRVNHFFH